MGCVCSIQHWFLHMLRIKYNYNENYSPAIILNSSRKITLSRVITGMTPVPGSTPPLVSTLSLISSISSRSRCLSLLSASNSFVLSVSLFCNSFPLKCGKIVFNRTCYSITLHVILIILKEFRIQLIVIIVL